MTQTVQQTGSRQYTGRQIAGVWAAASLPMATLSWVVAPWLAHRLDGPEPLLRALLVTITVGLVWQFVLVLLLVHRERGSVRWPVLKDALWLRAPRSPTTGRVGGRLWLILVPLVLLYATEEFIPTPPIPASRDLSRLLGSDAGASVFSGSWGWLALIVVLAVFNTVLGEELLFRGVLLPRMQGVFGRWDWVANGVLFAAYHLHVPWAMPATLVVDTFALSYPSRRYRSALIGIAVHSAQSVFLVAVTLSLVLG